MELGVGCSGWFSLALEGTILSRGQGDASLIRPLSEALQHGGIQRAVLSLAEVSECSPMEAAGNPKVLPGLGILLDAASNERMS